MPLLCGYIQSSYTRLRDGFLLDTHTKKFWGPFTRPVFYQPEINPKLRAGE